MLEEDFRANYLLFNRRVLSIRPLHVDRHWENSLYDLMLLTVQCSVLHLQVLGGRKVEPSLLEITCVFAAFGEVFYL